MTNPGIVGPSTPDLLAPLKTPSTATYGSESGWDPVSNRWVVRANGARYTPQNGLYNATNTSLKLFRQAMARQVAGAGVCRIHFFGDSITAGQTAGSPINTLAFPSRFRTALGSSSRFTPVTNGAIYFADFTNAQNTRDTRITSIGSWGQDTGGAGQGSAAHVTAGATPMVLTPDINVDTFVIYYARYGGGGTLTAQIDAGSTTTQSTNGATSVQSLTVTAALGSHTLSLNGTGAQIFVHAVEAFDSTVTTGVRVARCGVPGDASANWSIDFTYGGLSAAYPTGMVPDLTCLMIGTNDCSNNTPISTYTANVQTVITRARSLNGDIMLLVPPPTNSAVSVPKVLYNNALYALAEANDCALLDIDRFWGYSWAAMNASPYSYFTDANHPTAKGYAALGGLIANAVMSLV